MRRHLSTIVVLSMLFSGAALGADEPSVPARQRGFKPIWTVVGAGAGFGIGVWAGLTKFDDAIDSDRKVWTTAIVSAAVGGVLGYLVDRHRARGSSQPSALPTAFASPSSNAPWRQAVYGSPEAGLSLKLPSVATLTALDARPEIVARIPH